MRFAVPSPALQALKRLNEAGYEAYLVGGCVRDALRGTEPHDWDICTSAQPDEMLGVFKKFRTIPTGLKHGTAKIKGGIVEGKVQTVDALNAFGELPSKNALIAQVLGTFLAPITSLAYVLDQICQQKAGPAPAETPAE